MQATGGPSVAWSDTEQMLAIAVDLLAAANWQRGHNPKDPKPKPEPIPRPGEAEKKKREANEYAARLLAQRERTGR